MSRLARLVGNAGSAIQGRAPAQIFSPFAGRRPGRQAITVSDDPPMCCGPERKADRWSEPMANDAREGRASPMDQSSNVRAAKASRTGVRPTGTGALSVPEREHVPGTPAVDRPDDRHRGVRPLTAVAIAAIRVYQISLSHIFAFLGVRCRHAPTCSAYGIEAFARHGAWHGFWLTLSRLSRCHPAGSHGWDPVPAHRPSAGWHFWRLGDWAWTARLAPVGLASGVPESIVESPGEAPEEVPQEVRNEAGESNPVTGRMERRT